MEKSFPVLLLKLLGPGLNGRNVVHKQMEGIYSTTVNKKTLDESPMAYKPIESIIKNINGTVEILEIIKPIYNFKADE